MGDTDCKKIEGGEDALGWTCQKRIVRHRGTWAGLWRTLCCRKRVAVGRHSVRIMVWSEGQTEESGLTLKETKGSHDDRGRNSVKRLLRTSWCRPQVSFSPKNMLLGSIIFFFWKEKLQVTKKKIRIFSKGWKMPMIQKPLFICKSKPKSCMRMYKKSI